MTDVPRASFSFKEKTPSNPWPRRISSLTQGGGPAFFMIDARGVGGGSASWCALVYEEKSCYIIFITMGGCDQDRTGLTDAYGRAYWVGQLLIDEFLSVVLHPLLFRPSDDDVPLLV